MKSEAPKIPIEPILREMGVEVPASRGGYAKVVCIWHDDTRPSASVSRYGYRCWTCGKSGDAIKLAREEWNLNYVDALRRCQEISGISDDGIPRSSGWGDELSL